MTGASDPNGQASRSRTNAELLAAWRGGDSDAGDELFTRHYRPVERFFRNKVPDPRVTDLVQETFVACVEGRDRIDDGARFRAYVLTIAYRVFCKYLRESYRHKSDVDLDELSLEAMGTGVTSALVRVQEQRLLLEALRAIPVKYQVMLELYYWEELTSAEIAAVLGIPPATARSRLNRARDTLEAAIARLARSPELLDSTLTRLDDWAKQCGRAVNRIEQSP